MSTGSNTLKHVSDQASDISITQAGTPFTGVTDNLQLALNLFDPSALLRLPVIPYGTEFSLGQIRLATVAEIETPASNSVGVTPKKLNDFKLSRSPATDDYGWVKLASVPDVNSNSINVIPPARLETWMNARAATTTELGIARLSTEAMSIAGTDNITFMTSEDVLTSMRTHAAQPITASTTVAGRARLATDSEVKYGKSNVFMTPLSLSNRAASTSARGAFKTFTAVPTTNLNDYAITPANLVIHTPTSSRYGFPKLHNSLTQTSTSDTITANQGLILQNDLLSSSGGSITGTLGVDDLYANIKTISRWYFGSWWGYYYRTYTAVGKTIDNGQVLPKTALEGRPVGSIFMTVSSISPNDSLGGTWTKVQSRTIVGAGRGTDDTGQARTFYAGNSAGEFNNVLKENELPVHNHAGFGSSLSNTKTTCTREDHYWNGWNEISECRTYETTSAWEFGIDKGHGRANRGDDQVDKDNWYYNTSSAGNSQPHNNMQPHQVVNIWRRIR